MGSFRKCFGCSPTNIACGASRLGLKSAVITRIGDEHMGRLIREQLLREGVDIRGVKTDCDRLTALVLLGIRDEDQFPLIFYRENCADIAVSEQDIDPSFIAEARALLVTGTHLSNVRTEAAALKALRLAREAGARTALGMTTARTYGAWPATAKARVASALPFQRPRSGPAAPSQTRPLAVIRFAGKRTF